MNPVNDHEDGGEFTPTTLPVLTLTKREAMIAGYVQAWACDLADRGKDVRLQEAPALLDQVTKALKNEPHPPVPRDLPLIIAIIFGLLTGFLGALAVFISWWVAPYCR